MPDLRLAIPAVALWITCAVVVGVPSAGWAVAATAAIAAASMAGLAVWAVARPHASRASLPREPSRMSPERLAPIVALVAAATALGSAAIATQAPGRASDALDAAAEQSATTEELVRVERAPQRVASGFGGEARWSVRGHADTQSASVPVAVLFPASEEDARSVALGVVLRVHGRVLRNEAGEATTYTVSARGDPGVEIIEQPPAWLAWTASLRGTFALAAQKTPGDGGALLPGLAIGDETAVGPQLDQAMKASSLSHLTAVSGANCALVIGLVFALARLAGAGRRLRVVAAFLALGAFVALVGPGASVLRAAAMAAVLLIGLARGRPADGVPALSLAAIVLLVHDPWLARDYGFALSVLATSGLLVLAGPLSRLLSRWMPRAVAIALAVPTAAQLACQPVLVLLTPTLSLFGIPANLLAEPAAPVATVLGCIACLLLPWVPALGAIVVWLAWLPSAWIAQVAAFTSGLPGVALPWAAGAVGVALSAVVLVAVSVIVLGRTAPRVVSVTAVVTLCIGAAVYAGALGGNVIGRALALPGDWQIAACDVGQGDGVLLRDGDAVAMIDVGREPGPAAACLDRLGIHRLDFLLLTHFDADHVGGVAGVADRAARAIVQRPVREADTRTLAVLEAAGVPIERGHAGMAGTLGTLSWRLLWPPAPVTAGAAATASDVDTGNAGSLTLEAEGRGLRSVFLGDLGAEAQDALLATRVIRPVDVVKVAHHGSADQSPALYRALHARLGLVSVGAHNGYGHPTSSALRMLADSGTAVARTDEQGLLLVSPGPSGVQLWSERAATTSAGGRPYPGYGAASDALAVRRRPPDERGDTWQPEAAAEPAQARRAPSPARSRRCPGARYARLRWCWSPGRRASSPIARSARCATLSRPTIPVSRSATCTRAITPRGSCSPSRAPPCSVSPGSSGSRPSRSATTRSSPTCSPTSNPRPTAPW